MEARGAAVEGLGIAAAQEVDKERLAGLVKRYTFAATAIFLVAGVLGVLMRQSQADVFRLDDNFFYSIMTAHGLGTFMAWAAFAVMGFGFWVLMRSGMNVRPAGYLLADVTWWVTVTGTAGIVVTTLFLGFGGSWVFLYPLPFFSSNQWGDAATGIFAASVLLVGVGIITWCLAILHTVVGPSSPAAERGIPTRIGVAMGMGLLFPGMLDDPKRPIPYPVIPLTVIALDMVIATLPLAVLLVIMIAQSIDSSITVDPLLAKNMLWFFGHPVVYLLLFPAVAIFYQLIPEFAKRPLAAARIIAIAWLVAVTANISVWAHHIYLDYPEDSIQDIVNMIMEPTTFSITIVSALSIYSLSATIYRSDFEWNPASKFLLAGMVGWLTAGLSGVINATIAFDKEVHNTLWIVGHFHHMALLTIGLVVFGATYAFLPELTGRRLYSRKLADWHLWLTLIGGYGNSIVWYVQGLNGGPRRYSVLPEHYETLTFLTLPFVVMVALGQLVFAYNLVQTLRGRERAHDERSLWEDQRLFSLAGTTAVTAFVLPLLLVGLRQAGGPAAVSTSVPANLDPQARELFAQTCGSCHTLAAAGTTATIGPQLDLLAPSSRRTLRAIEIGGTGSGQMPPGLLQGQEAQDVADFVAEATGAARASPPGGP